MYTRRDWTFVADAEMQQQLTEKNTDNDQSRVLTRADPLFMLLPFIGE